MEENTTKISETLYLTCLCGKHPEDSDCEVYLRNRGTWKEPDLQLCSRCNTMKKIPEHCPVCLRCWLEIIEFDT